MSTARSDGGGLPPEAAFALLANETRVATLQALWDSWGEGPVSFSRLREAVGMRDTGQFHYHLEKLQDHYVRKVEADVGYVLTPAGFKIAQSVIAGTGIDAPALEASPTDAACPRCEGTVDLTYTDGVVRIHCTECPGFWSGRDGFGPMEEGYLGGWEFPPAGLADRTPSAILDASILYMITRTEALLAGVCPDCSGPVDGQLSVCDDHRPEAGVCEQCGRQFRGLLRWNCGICKLEFGAPSWAAAIHHPPVRAALDREGLDYRDNPWGTLHVGYDRNWEETVRDGEPLELTIHVVLDDTAREVILDESGQVIDAESG